MNQENRLKTKHLSLLKPSPVQFIILTLLATLPVLFQNCSAPLEEQGLSSLGGSFPFEEKMDHIAHMSCTGMSNITSNNIGSYFSYKVTALNPGHGVRLSRDFISATRNLTVSDKIRALSEDSDIRDTFLALGVRQTSNMQGLFCDNTNFCSGSFYGNFLGSLTNSTVATALVNKIIDSSSASYVSDFPNGSIEEAIYVNTNSNIASDLRAKIANGEAALAVTFNKGTAEGKPLPLGAPKVYGTSYRMNFSTDATAPVARDPHLMINPQEFDLLTGQKNSSSLWSCWHFQIVKQTDAATYCPGYATEPNVPPTSPDAEKYYALRAILPQLTWGVSLANSCVVEKSGNVCYGAATGLTYNRSLACGTGAGTCPNYVSVCKRR